MTNATPDQTAKHTTLRITLLRHGETDSGPVYRGRIDAQLSPTGWQQLRVATQIMQPDFVVTSPLQRCRGFAHSIMPDAVVDECFIEMDFGLWDGRLRDEVWQEAAAQVQAFWADPMHVSPPQGENLTQVLTRASQALYRYIHQALAANAQHLLVVSHGGVIRVLLAEILHMSPSGMFQLYLPYAGTVELVATQFVDEQTNQPELDIQLNLSGLTANDKTCL